jgi:hypothetical protein
LKWGQRKRRFKGSNAPDGAGSIGFKEGSNAPDGAGSIGFKGSNKVQKRKAEMLK